MRSIDLHNNDGEVVGQTLVDDEDYDLIAHYGGVYPDGKGYAMIHSYKNVKRHMFLHRFLLQYYGTDITNKVVDHINFNGLDNQKSNLGACTKQENNQHQRKRRPDIAFSKYRGVHRDKTYYVTRVKNKYIANFENERDAAICYDLFAEREYGDFSFKNVPDASKEDVVRVLKLVDKKQRKVYKSSKSKYKCVSKRGQKYIVRITYQKKRILIGSFNDEKDAALAYNQKAIELFGDNAVLNIIE